jgi:hypothetical protein
MLSLRSEPINPVKKRKLYQNYASRAVGNEFFIHSVRASV